MRLKAESKEQDVHLHYRRWNVATVAASHEYWMTTNFEMTKASDQVQTGYMRACAGYDTSRRRGRTAGETVLCDNLRILSDNHDQRSKQPLKK